MGTVLSVAAETPPRRKSGLWEIKTTIPNASQTLTAQTCVDERSDDLWKQETEPDTQMTCSKTTTRKERDTWVVESVCQMESSTATIRAVFTGNFDSSYRTEIKSTYTPPLMGMKDATTMIEAKWLGPCKPGQKPGDIIMPELERAREMMKEDGAKNP